MDTNAQNEACAKAFQKPFVADKRKGGGESYHSGNFTINREGLSEMLKLGLLHSNLNDPNENGVPYVTYIVTDEGKKRALEYIRASK